MRAWKWIGLAGVVGLATAAGFYVVRQSRTWDDAEPDELRDRLHTRVDAARSRSAANGSGDADQVSA
ncbi:MAG: hypothetical protein HRT86_05500 [Ilumatobacteraceae bacterium]|nr:hypothetical protein [Ilumatobacteraceae bacterium]